jgi:hypothetical protein
MDRMLTGKPTITRPGLLSKAGLAREAQVDRNHITQGSCRDLGDRFAALTKQLQEPTTAREVEQQKRIENLLVQLDNLTEANATIRGDRDKWQASTQTLLRAMQVLRLEQLAMRSDITVLTRQLEAAQAGATTGLYVVQPPGS